jgi:CTP synthase
VNGMRLSGLSEDGRLAEFIELQGHPYFVATQAHNELTSRLEKPNPLFFGFIRAALAQSKKV